jgi:hypothetical protein
MHLHKEISKKATDENSRIRDPHPDPNLDQLDRGMDPHSDPYQNFMDPQHCIPTRFFGSGYSRDARVERN